MFHGPHHHGPGFGPHFGPPPPMYGPRYFGPPPPMYGPRYYYGPHHHYHDPCCNIA